MILYPAIDLKGGRCVRLLRGEMDAATTYNHDPADQARRFRESGFAWLHVVDLDGAFAGSSANAPAVAAILAATDAPVQLGGGVRDRAGIERWLEAGVARVILGTAAVRDPGLVREAARTHPGRIAVGVDVRDGRVAVSGWAEACDLSAVDVARRFEDAGVAALIITDIGRDGTLEGVNVEATGALADAVAIPVIASGGVASVDDLLALKARAGAPIAGAILGKSLYAGRIAPADALKAAA
ncbi:MAG: 1-(5-phosphoribosyl)-5-[(5-phosphoribosylamino)methylideneamino]imidazole-4-carboxamide isomerase [Caulobacteraceae bacterium]|nr:1-(5-phosphoribosyl)-5-[(5-phosphoribosylamino)methylideneamino]imidazole-4-carboxamide isomerase [Caulobacter sp.]